MKFIVQAQLNVEVEADDIEEAKKLSEEKFRKAEELGFGVKDAKVVHEQTGYFLK